MATILVELGVLTVTAVVALLFIVRSLLPKVNTPAVKVRVPLIVFELFKLTPAALFIVKLTAPDTGNSESVVVCATVLS